MFLHELARKQLTDLAIQQGFHTIGFTPAQDAQRFPSLCDWLDRGFAASMNYIEKRREAYRHPCHVLPECKTVIVLTLPYQGHAWTDTVTKRGKQRQVSVDNESTIGSYAGAREDYHNWIRRKLKVIVRELRGMFPACHARAVVDTAPLLERDFAQQAGLGWIGKNTMLLNRELGSYFFLSAILTQIDFLEHSQPATTGQESQRKTTATMHCGTCTACLDACPTDAFAEPYVLNANRCISYWTIEHKGAIPEETRPMIGPWLFGCDICQIVCPWNKKVAVNVPDGIRPESIDLKSDVLHWLTLQPAQFESLYRDTPFERTGLHGMQRNAMIVAANLGKQEAIPKIQEFRNHPNEELRSLADWAIAKIL